VKKSKGVELLSIRLNMYQVCRVQEDPNGRLYGIGNINRGQREAHYRPRRFSSSLVSVWHLKTNFQRA